MGYYWTMTDSNIQIPSEHFTHIRRDAQREWYSGANFPKINYPKNCGPEVSNKAFIAELFMDYGFEVSLELTGVVYVWQDGEKLREQENLLELIAPYCEEGCYVAGRGEEGEMWRWTLSPKDGLGEEAATVVYESQECPVKNILEGGCVRCSFSLVCSTADSTVLKGSTCYRCGGTLVSLLGSSILAGITCSCISRKFVPRRKFTFRKRGVTK